MKTRRDEYISGISKTYHICFIISDFPTNHNHLHTLMYRNQGCFWTTSSPSEAGTPRFILENLFFLPIPKERERPVECLEKQRERGWQEEARWLFMAAAYCCCRCPSVGAQGSSTGKRSRTSAGIPTVARQLYWNSFRTWA